MAPRLRFAGLCRSYGRMRVLRDVSGEVGAGELLLVTGRNGSGKSTLLKCLAGLLAAEKGAIDYHEGETGFDIAGRRERVGYVAPDLSFYEELSALENLAFFARLRGLPVGRAKTMIERVGLPPGRLAGALSSGMRQRLRWAWALLAEPRLLLLDEPFQNLDAAGEALSRELLAAHRAGGGAAVLATPTPLAFPDGTRDLSLGE